MVIDSSIYSYFLLNFSDLLPVKRLKYRISVNRCCWTLDQRSMNEGDSCVINAAGSALKRMCACLVVIGSTCERPFSHNSVVWLGAEPVSSISTLPLRCCCWAWGTKPAVAVSQWSCCRIGDHRRWIDDLLVVLTALPAARSSTTRHFEVLDFLGFDLCMRIK